MEGLALASPAKESSRLQSCARDHQAFQTPADSQIVNPWASLRRLLARSPAPAPAPPVRARAREEGPATATVPVKSPPPPVPTALTDDEAMSNLVAVRLRAEFSQAIQRIADELPQDQRTPDLMTLVGHLAGDPEGRLRRPPTAAQRAMSACTNEDVPTTALVPLLEADPLLTQGVLARANSAAYHRSGPPC